jgi:hypothetical protein
MIVLDRILAVTEDVNVRNNRGETFLHVIAPGTETCKPSTVVLLFKNLQGKGFHFCQLDDTKRSFLERMLHETKFPLPSVELMLIHVNQVDRDFLLGHTANGGKLHLSWIREIAEEEPYGHWFVTLFYEYLIGRHLTRAGTGVTEMNQGTLAFPEASPNKMASSLHGAIMTIGRVESLVWEAACHDGPVLLSTCGFEEVLELMLKNGLGLHTHPRTGQTPLMAFLNQIAWVPHDPGFVERCVILFLGRVFFPVTSCLKISDKHGNQPLHYAAALGLPRVVEIFLGYGADERQRNQGEFTPIDMARHALRVRQSYFPGFAHLDDGLKQVILDLDARERTWRRNMNRYFANY